MKNRLLVLAAVAAAAAAVVLGLRRRGPTPEVAEIAAALEEAYASTVAALATHADESDHASDDARAQSSAERLSRVLAANASRVDAETRSSLQAFAELVEAEQIRIMTFAINRKNRLPDGGQIDTENDDREKFAAEASPLFEALKAKL